MTYRERILPLLIPLLAFVLAACGEDGEPEIDAVPGGGEPPVETDRPEEEPALDIVGTPLGADRTFRLSDQRGRLVVLNFFATWCPPCREEIPDLVRISDELGDRLVLVGISVDQNPADVLPDFINEYGINYPIIPWDALEDYDAVYDHYPHASIPTTYVIDARGRLVERVIGSRDYATFLEIFEGYLE